MIDLNRMKYIGWDGDDGIGCMKTLFTPQVIRFISRKISENLEGVDYLNRTIIVPDESIISVMNNIYANHRPRTGDIFTRYVIPDSNPNNTRQDIIDKTIETITDQTKIELETIRYNSSLTKWTTVLGDFNSQGLRSHPEIKTKKRRVNTLQFNMNY